MTTTQHRLDAVSPQAMARRLVLGANVRIKRKALGLSQERVAERAGCNRQSVNRVENGAYSPSADRLWRLADALTLPNPSSLFVVESTPRGQGAIREARELCLSVIRNPAPAGQGQDVVADFARSVLAVLDGA